MAGEINWGILDPNAPAKIASSVEQGRQNALAAQGAQQQQQMNALALKKAQLAMEDEQAAREAYAPYGGKAGFEIKAKEAEMKGKELTQRKAQIETGVAQLGAVAQLLGSVRDQSTYDQARQKAATMFGPESVADLNPVYNPQDIEGLQQQTLTAKDKAEIEHKRISEELASIKFRYQQQHDAESLALRRSGQGIAREANVIAREVAGAKRTQDVEMKLADDYRAESKGFAEVSTSMKKVLGSLKTADKNAGSALAAGTAFMKILDPNSVVRESELGMALNASGWFDRASNVVNTMKSGKIMTPEQVRNLTAASNALFDEAKKAQLEVDASFRQRAKSYGADPRNIITERGQQAEAKVGIPPGATHGGKNPRTGQMEYFDAQGNRVK